MAEIRVTMDYNESIDDEITMEVTRRAKWKIENPFFNGSCFNTSFTPCRDDIPLGEEQKAATDN